MLAGWLIAWPKPLYLGPWWPDPVSCNHPHPPFTPSTNYASKGLPEQHIACPSVGGRVVLWPSASCLRTYGVGSLGARLAAIQVKRSGMVFFLFFFFFGGGNCSLSQMISGYGKAKLLLSLLCPALFWSICKVFLGSARPAMWVQWQVTTLVFMLHFRA